MNRSYWHGGTALRRQAIHNGGQLAPRRRLKLKLCIISNNDYRLTRSLHKACSGNASMTGTRPMLKAKLCSGVGRHAKHSCTRQLVRMSQMGRSHVQDRLHQGMQASKRLSHLGTKLMLQQSVWQSVGVADHTRTALSQGPRDLLQRMAVATVEVCD